MQSVKRSIKSSQPKVREFTFKLDGVIATPAASELDASQVKSVTDLGAGNYTVIFSNPLQSATMKWLVKGIVAVTANIIVEVTATADDRITVQARIASTGVATDAVMYITVVGTDSLILY
jgi:hypothetical protein